MPLPVAKVRFKCAQCQKSKWLKPSIARARTYCSRACKHAANTNPDKKPRWVPANPETRTCAQCGVDYLAKTRHQRYCSQPCATRGAQEAHRRTDNPPRQCETCGVTFQPRPGNAGRFCSRPCLYKGSTGEKAGHWRGGRYERPDGYVRAYAPNHPRASGHGYLAEHILVMEQSLGRFLEKGETVHHINLDRSDNRIENLQLRKGKHGAGAVHQCGDCGSTNILTVKLAG